MQDNIRRPLVAQAHLSTQEAPSLAPSWLHAPQQDEERQGRPQTPHAEGQVAARRLSGLRPDASGQAGKQMRKELRLRRRKDFDAVFRNGRAWHNELLVLRTVPNALEHNRYGFITSKRVGKAVVRNRVRRRLKEAVRVLPAKPGWDVVVSTKARAAEVDFHALNGAVIELMTRAGILNQQTGEEPA
jgi:ribonuclease P protein component